MDADTIEAGVSEEDIRQLREHLDRKLSELFSEVGKVRDDTRRINGRVNEHDQTLYGVDRKGDGLVDKVKEAAGEPQWRTIWAALATVAAFGSIALMAWLGSGAA